MFWVAISHLLDLLVLWMGAAVLFLIPLFIGLGIWHAICRGLNEVGKCFVHVFTMHKPEEEDEEVEVLVVENTDEVVNSKQQERIQDDNLKVTQKKGRE